MPELSPWNNVHIKFFTSVPKTLRNDVKKSNVAPGYPLFDFIYSSIEKNEIPSIINQKGRLAYLMHRSKISENIELIGQIDAAAAP